MKKEASNAWLRMKTLPKRAPGFASGLCTMVCLWLVLIPALVMAARGSLFDLHQLIAPSLGALVLSAILFSAWKKSALKLPDEKTSGLVYNPQLLERRLNRLALTATNLQWGGIAVLFLAISTREVLGNYIANYNYASSIQGFSIFALSFSFVLGRLYASARKKLEEAKKLTEDEKIGFQHEYLLKFLWPPIFWGVCFAIFGWLVV